VIPTGDLLRKPVACGESESRGPGACLLSGRTQQFSCFTATEIGAGRAFAALDVTRAYGRVVGLVPDGTTEVELFVHGRTFRLPVRENLVQRYVRGLRPGEPVEVQLKDHETFVYVVASRVPSPRGERIASRIRSRLRVKTQVVGETHLQRGEVAVKALRPGSEALANAIARLLNAHRVPEPPSTAGVGLTTPDVIVTID
jgi:hypothetical protein